MIVSFGPWRPDAGPWAAGDHLVEAKNVVPYRDYYGPFNPPVEIHPTAIAGTARGLWTGENERDSITSFAGDGNSIFKLSQSSRADVSKPGGYTLGATARWRTVEFDGEVIATTRDAPIQAYNLSTSTTYTDLSGTAPKADYISVVGDYLMVGNIIDNTLGSKPANLAWSGFGDARDWDVSGTGGSGQKTIFDLGPITGLTGGQVGVALCRRGIVRIEQIGNGLGGAPFAFRTLTSELGCEIPGTVLKNGRFTYFYSQAGWVRTDGYQIERIGAGFIDDWFRLTIDRSKPQHFWAVADTGRDMLLFSAPRTVQLTTDGDLDMARILLVYRPTVPNSRWSYIERPTVLLGKSQTFVQTSDDLTELCDDLDILCDDPSFGRGEEVTAAVSFDDKISSFSGSPLEALFETSAIASQESARYVLGDFEVFHDGGDAALAIGTSEHAGEAASWTPDFERLDDGRFRYQTAGRHIRARAKISGGWRRANGLEFGGRFGGKR